MPEHFGLACCWIQRNEQCDRILEATRCILASDRATQWKAVFRDGTCQIEINDCCDEDCTELHKTPVCPRHFLSPFSSIKQVPKLMQLCEDALAFSVRPSVPFLLTFRKRCIPRNGIQVELIERSNACILYLCPSQDACHSRRNKTPRVACIQANPFCHGSAKHDWMF